MGNEGKFYRLKGAPTITQVSTVWIAKDPEVIFSGAVRAAGDILADKMVDFRNGKRLSVKLESTLDQAALIQLICNTEDNMATATNMGPPLPLAASDNMGIGLAWDDWHPYVGVRMTFAVAPTAGSLRVVVVVQE